MKKRDLIKMYSLPSEVRYCKKCTMSNQRPRITLDGGVYVAHADSMNLKGV